MFDLDEVMQEITIGDQTYRLGASYHADDDDPHCPHCEASLMYVTERILWCDQCGSRYLISHDASLPD